MSRALHLEGSFRHLCSLKYKLKAVKQLGCVSFAQHEPASGSGSVERRVLRGVRCWDPARRVRKGPSAGVWGVGQGSWGGSLAPRGG